MLRAPGRDLARRRIRCAYDRANCSLGEVEAVVPTVDRRCWPRGANMRSEMEEDGVNGNVAAMCS